MLTGVYWYARRNTSPDAPQKPVEEHESIVSSLCDPDLAKRAIAAMIAGQLAEESGGKRSGLVVLRDFLQDLNFQQELERQLHRAVQEMLRDEKLVPSRKELVDRLNRMAPVLGTKLRLEVRFQ